MAHAADDQPVPAGGLSAAEAGDEGRTGDAGSLAHLARRLDAEPREGFEAEALLAAASAAAGAHRLEDVLEVLAEAARSATGARAVSILRSEGPDLVRTVVKVGQLGPGEERFPAEDVSLKALLPLARDVLENGCAFAIDADAPDLPFEGAELLSELGAGAAVAAPIVHEGVVWGQLLATAGTGATGFAARHLRLVQAMCEHLSGAIVRAEAFSRIAALAFEDPLTGLANRRALDEAVERLVSEARAGGTDVALLFCDVDGLKEVNDNFGHDAGDRALVSVAEVLSLVALDFPEALVSRIGGDEFCVVLPGNGSEAARRFAEEASRLLGEDHPPAVTLSTGAASLALGAQTAADLFRAADAAQYAAKRGGRGRIVVAADSRARRLGEQTARGRRSLRDRHASELQRQLGVTTALLDEVLTRAPALERLEAVAVGLAETLDAAEWAVSCASAGGTRLSVMRGQYRRGAAGESAGRFEFGDGEDAYPLADFPATAAIVARGGAFVVDAENPLADEAEVAFLEEWGYTAMLAAAAADETGVYVVELFADDRTRELATAKAQLRLLVLAAVQGAGAGVRF